MNQKKKRTPVKAAEILHQIELICRKRSPYKISLIKCVGLLNASLFRNLVNAVMIPNDICKVCCCILQQANSKIKAVDLIGKANEVKILF